MINPAYRLGGFGAVVGTSASIWPRIEAVWVLESEWNLLLHRIGLGSALSSTNVDEITFWMGGRAV